MKFIVKSILLILSKNSVYLPVLMTSLILFFILLIQPVQGEPLINESSFSACNFADPIEITRPNSEGEATQVSLGISLLDIVQLNEIRETFDSKFFMELKWQDIRLSKALQNQALPYCHIAIDRIWHPQIYIFNHRKLTTEFDKIVTINWQGIVTYKQIFDAEVGSFLDFKKFPFDSQNLSIKIIILNLEPKDIQLVENQQVNRLSNKLSFVGWSVSAARTRTETENIELLQKSRTLFAFEIDVKRESRFILWKSLLPVTIIVLVTYLVFWLEPTVIIPQVALSSITLISVITYQLNLSFQRPQIPYLTAEDIFLIGSILLIVLALIETIVSYNLAQGKFKYMGLQIDIVFRWLFPILLLGLMLFAFL